MTVFRAQTREDAADLLLTVLNYCVESSEDFAFTPLTVDKVLAEGLTVTPVPAELSHMLRSVVDAG